MSFSSDTKHELCTRTSTRKQLQYSELYAMLLLSKQFTPSSIVFKTENEDAFSHFAFLLSTLFKAKLEVIGPMRGESGKNRNYTVSLPRESDCKRIYTYYGHEPSEVSRRVNRANLDDEDMERAFIRGAFIACGSVTDPEKRYHLEFSVAYRNLCLDICHMIREIRESEIAVKMLSRAGAYIAYVKDSEQITDLLTYMGATGAAMSIMGTKALKQVRNIANRRANSEIANLERTASAAALQIRAINALKASGDFNLLSDELKAVAALRVEYPELTLRELGERLDPPISRSGVNHRIEKIIRLSKEVKHE